MRVSSSASHRQPVRSTKEMASIAARSGTRGLWQPSGSGWSGSGGAMSVCAPPPNAAPWLGRGAWP